MRALRVAMIGLWCVGFALLAGCGGGDGGPTDTGPIFENIAGTYNGELAGVTQGVLLTATFSLTVVQNQGSLTGSTAIVGTLTDGVDVVVVSGTGSFTGTIAAGNNPSINITMTNQCPNYSARFSGSLDSANNLLTLSGPIDILFDDCTIFLTYQFVILLRR